MTETNSPVSHILTHDTLLYLIHIPPSLLLLTNTQNTARKEAERAAKESAKRFQVNSTIATKTAEEFKQLSEKQKAAKKESIESAKLNKGAGVIVSVHDTTLEFKKMQDERLKKKKEAIGTLHLLTLLSRSLLLLVLCAICVCVSNLVFLLLCLINISFFFSPPRLFLILEQRLPCNTTTATEMAV